MDFFLRIMVVAGWVKLMLWLASLNYKYQEFFYVGMIVGGFVLTIVVVVVPVFVQQTTSKVGSDIVTAFSQLDRRAERLKRKEYKRWVKQVVNIPFENKITYKFNYEPETIVEQFRAEIMDELPTFQANGHELTLEMLHILYLSKHGYIPQHNSIVGCSLRSTVSAEEYKEFWNLVDKNLWDVHGVSCPIHYIHHGSRGPWSRYESNPSRYPVEDRKKFTTVESRNALPPGDVKAGTAAWMWDPQISHILPDYESAHVGLVRSKLERGQGFSGIFHRKGWEYTSDSAQYRRNKEDKLEPWQYTDDQKEKYDE